jgi:signal transduction histidine kinase
MAQPVSEPGARAVPHLLRYSPRLIRAAWIALVLLALAVFVAGLPTRWDELRQEFRRHIGFYVVENSAGEIVASPWSSGPAARAGILERDIVVVINGTPAKGKEAIEAAAEAPLGTTVTLDVRTGARPTRTATLALGGDEGRPFAPFGLSFGVVAAFVLALDSVAVAALILLAGVLLWRKPGELVPTLVAATMLAIVSASAPVTSLYRAQPDWQPPIDFVFGLALGCVMTFFFLFPDGRFVPNWTRVLFGMAALWVLTAPVFPVLYPWRLGGWPGLLVMLASLGVGVAAQAYRYARVATVVQRQQTKWVVFGAVLGAVGVGLQLGIEVVGDRSSAVAVLRDQLFIRPISQLLIGMLPVSIAIALFRYRLWDIDIILHRSLVYALLTASTLGIYVLVVSGVRAVLTVEGNPLASLLAAGVVAVLFQRLREYFQGAASRLLFGDRDDPYAAITRLGRRLGATLAHDAVLQAVVTSVRDALKLPYAAILLRREEDLVIASASGEPTQAPLSLPLLYQGELLGELRVAPRAPGESWTGAERRLLEDLAGQAGIALHAVRVTRDLQLAREQLVLAREEERRRLRRDLHDELAPTLAALGLTTSAARDLLKPESADAADLLKDVQTGLRRAVGDIRRIAYELRPPVLDELGLVAAIRERAARLDGAGSLRVTVEAPEHLPALPAAAEVAAFRIVQEALMNVVRHAQATHCLVRLALDDGLRIEVIDDGIGQFARAQPGVGLRSMRERATELGGQCIIEPRSPSGTRLFARLPLEREVVDGPTARTDRG